MSKTADDPVTDVSRPAAPGLARDPVLARAIAAVGSSLALSSRLGVTPQALSQWRRVPASRVLAVEQATGVARHELRPDLYPVGEGQP